MGGHDTIEFVNGSRIQIIKTDDYYRKRGLQVGATGTIISTYNAVGGPAARVRMDEKFFGGHSLGGECEDGHGIAMLLEYVDHEAAKELPEFECEDIAGLF